jgi:hypothetical protein
MTELCGNVQCEPNALIHGHGLAPRQQLVRPHVGGEEPHIGLVNQPLPMNGATKLPGSADKESGFDHRLNRSSSVYGSASACYLPMWLQFVPR